MRESHSHINFASAHFTQNGDGVPVLAKWLHGVCLSDCGLVSCRAAEYTQKNEQLAAEASYDNDAIEDEKRALEEEKAAVIETIQQGEKECRVLDSGLDAVRKQGQELAAELDCARQNRDVSIPENA